MNSVDALRILQDTLGHTESGARQVLADINTHLKNKDGGKVLEDYQVTWFPGILADSNEIGKVRLGELVRTNFVPELDQDEIDRLLTLAFPVLG